VNLPLCYHVIVTVKLLCNMKLNLSTKQQHTSGKC